MTTTGTRSVGRGATTYSVSGNPPEARRTGTLTIAGQTHAVSQTAKGDDGGGGGK